MHELSLIQSLVELVAYSARENGITRVTLVKLVVGEYHGALPGALQFAFSCLTPDTPLAGAELEIEIKPVKLHCHSCGLVFSPSGWSAVCPGCGSSTPDVLQGRELFVDYFEGDEREGEAGESDSSPAAAAGQ
ncbi:hydrogenase maturation nickel metallochaperone HypA [Desulfotomaculum copahuensis]|uniref:Hydrogenase maturation factor HypA n=1 Tax=Desulfotomaculum copahuensis TaxID=1838280 RepID=A0A1B7LHA8_9FIRM|nr:hydrogenase maturation nickel metallochaperone HypA [Desulfotomaculum copahuensis]OAT85572.1 hydrogenase nickel insertion protein HypA [Desulfotomaculum copahuensis]